MPLDKKRDHQAGDVFTASEIVRVTYLEQGSRRARKEKKPGRTLINGERIDFKDYLDTGLAASVWKVGSKYYNEERPHSAIGNMPPIMLANSDGDTSPPC